MGCIRTQMYPQIWVYCKRRDKTRKNTTCAASKCLSGIQRIFDTGNDGEKHISGGSGEIRTHEGLPLAGFQDRCNRPLCHASLFTWLACDAGHILAVSELISQQE